MVRPLILAALCAAACAGEPPRALPGDARVTLDAGKAWRATFETRAMTAAIDLGPSLEDYRLRNWTPQHGFEIAQANGRDLLRRTNGEQFDRAVVDVVPAPANLPKDYEPFILMGDGGAIVYTGAFIPYADEKRMETTLTVRAGEGAKVAAFGEAAPEFVDWVSPFRTPAFLYVGPNAGAATPGPVRIITDATAPDFIRSEVAEMAPRLGAAFETLFARALPVTPDIFVAIGDLSEPGRLSYSGDALPGQYQMTLEGGFFAEDTAQTRGVIRRQTAHEAAHLWQAATQPRSDAVPQWIHEGAAEALAAEAMLAAGYWTAADASEDLESARGACIASLAGRSLQSAEAAANWTAVYQCGRILNVAAAGEEGVAALWRDFIGQTATTGYDQQAFMALAREREGPETEKAMLDLLRINDANSEGAVDRVLGRAPAAP
jgi:hypothetical protein